MTDIVDPFETVSSGSPPPFPSGRIVDPFQTPVVDSGNPYAKYVQQGKATLQPPSGSWLKSQLGGTGKQDYGQGLGYLVDNPVTRGMGGAANSLATGGSELAQRAASLVSPTAAAWLKNNVTTPLAQRQADFETPASAGIGSDITQAVSGLAGQVAVAGLTGGAAPEAEAAAAAPGVLGRLAPYLTRPAITGAATLGVTQAGADAAQQEAAGQTPESTASLLGHAALNTAANLVPMGGSGNVLRRVATGALAGEGVNEAQNLINGQPLGTNALLSAGLGAGLGLIPHAHAPYPNAAPGSLSDAANTIHEDSHRPVLALPAPVYEVSPNGRVGTTSDQNAAIQLQQARENMGITPDIERTQGARWDTANSPQASTLRSPLLQQQTMAPETTQAAGAPSGEPAATPAPAAKNADRVPPAAPYWMNPDTGELTAPTQDQLTQALADHMTAQYAATGDMRIAGDQLAKAWNVPQSQIDRTKKAAQQLARDNVAAAERAAMNPGADALQPQSPAEAAAAAPMLGTNEDSPGQPLHSWTPVDATQRVPYAGGVASDGRAIYLDPALPASVNVDGKDVNAHDAVAYHESVEFPLMHLTGPMSDADIQALAERAGLKSPDDLPDGVVADLKAGKSLDYGPAHDIATLSENKFVADRYGVDPEKYQAALKEGIDAARTQAPGSGQTPADLDAKPYVNMGESSLANGVEPTTADAQSEGAGDVEVKPTQENAADAVPGNQGRVPAVQDRPAGSEAEAEQPAAGAATGQGVTSTERTADSDAAPPKTEVSANGEPTETPPQGGVSTSDEPVPKVQEPPRRHKLINSKASRDAEGLRVKTEGGELNGRTHVDQLIDQGYNQVRSIPAGDRMQHSLVNDAGEGKPIKPRQLRYAEEATTAHKSAAPAAESTDAHSPYAAGNKVVGDDGKPLTVYHGTREMFAGPFDQKKSRDAGVWFTPHKPATEMYGESVIPAHVRLENPYEAKVGESRQRSLEKAGNDGHDGVIVRDDKGHIQTLSVFDSKAIHRLDEGGENAEAHDDTEAKVESAPLFRKDVPTKADDSVDRVTSTVRELTSTWKGNDLPDVHVVASAKDLPEHFKSEGYESAKGAYDGKGIWVVADRHPDTDAGRGDLAKTLAHEAIGHYGIDRIVNRELGADAWSKIQGSIERLDKTEGGGDAMQKVLADVHRRYPVADADTFARETLAVMAEKGVRNGLLDRAVTAVRQFLRKVLPDLKLNDAELRQLLVKSKAFIEHGESYGERVQGRAATAFALTGKNSPRKLALDSNTLEQVRGRFGRIEGWFKREFGYGYDGLTESEARTMLSYDGGRLSPDTLRARILAKRIPDLRSLGESAVGDRSGAEASGTAGRTADQGISDAHEAGSPDTPRGVGVTDTPEFRKFFGDSKVVDAGGKPLTVYHGTSEDFSVFKADRAGSATAHDTSALGHFFTPDRALADRYAENASEGRPADKRVVDAYLSVQKPYEMPLKDAQAIDSQAEAKALRAKLEAEGYDGIHVPESDTWIAFHSGQIKSASENRGTFDKANPNIYFRRDVDDSGEPEKQGKPNRPFSQAAASIESMQEEFPQLDKGLFQRFKDAIAGKARDLEPAALGALQLRHVLELMGDIGPIKDASEDYAENFQKLDATRNKEITDGTDLVQRLQKWWYQPGLAGWLGKERPEAIELARLMHDTTQVDIDPLNAYERLTITDSRGDQMPWTQKLIDDRVAALHEQMRGRSDDDKQPFMDEIKDLRSLPARERARQQKYPDLVARLNALSPEAKQWYMDIRDHYAKQSEKLEQILVDRIKERDDIPRQNKSALIQKIHKSFADSRLNGVYFPLKRFGDFWASGYDQDGHYFFTTFESAKEAKNVIARLRQSGAQIEQVGRKDSNYGAKDAPSGTFVKQIVDLLEKHGAPEKVRDEFTQMFLRTLPELSLQKQGIHRKNVAGFTEDVPRVLSSNIFHGAHQLSKLQYEPKLAAAIQKIEERVDGMRLTEEPDLDKAAHADALLGELKRRHDWIMNPTNNPLASKASSIAFGYHLSASPVAALTYALQLPQIVLPVLGAHHGWPSAMRALGAATRDAIRTGGHIDRVLQGEDLLAHKALQQQGTFQRTGTHTLAGLSEGDMIKSNPAWAKVMGAVSYMFHTSEVINREATGMAAFRLARERGQTFDQAVKYADQMTNGTHGDYSNANRARYMQGNVAKVVLQFKSYSLAMSWLWGRNFYQAFKAESPEVRAVARKTLTGLTGMTALLAGAMGLPMYNALKAGGNAVHAVTGDPNEPFDFDTEFRSWLSEHLGQTAANVIADGPANQLGADVASRTSMSDLWFRDVDRQLEGEAAYDNLLESIAGPLGGMVKNMYVGAQQYNQGNVWRGIETMMPTAAKNAMKAMRYASQGVNTLKGDPIVPDISAPEDLIQAMGFTPTKVADQMRINSALENYSQQIQSRRTALMNAFAMASTAGDQDGQSDALSAIRDFNTANPEIPISMIALRDSLRTRAKNAAEADNGVTLNKRLAGTLRQAVGAEAAN